MTRPQHWDIFCKVIDNFGDIGVCWRLASQLAARGQQVRLWVDDTTALAWMAPQGCPGVTVKSHSQLADYVAGDVLVEAFGCEIAPEIIAAHAIDYWASEQKGLKTPAWINLEYLSAEPFVERNHGLASPVMSGPAKGLSKWFFYPGFTQRTGGLLREPDLALRQAQFSAPQWLQQLGTPVADAQQTISLFCYEPAALPQWLAQLASGPQRTRLLVTHGRAAAAVQNCLEANFSKQIALQPSRTLRGQLSISEHLSIQYLPALSQTDYDHLLWICQLNCVRGEDSLVRALWAGQPLIWHIYPQHDGAHAAKLDAFLDWLQAPPDVRAFHQVWNGLSTQPLPVIDLPAYAAVMQAARQRLLMQTDLATQLLDFAQQHTGGKSQSETS
jgi:uncharacterized repeat protein (TIGR03837 family)